MAEMLTICRNVGRKFLSGTERLSVLQDIDCEIREGDRIALAGPSGSGKTTLLHILGGLDRQTSGEIEWPSLGTIEQLRPRRIGFVFQSPSLFPALTAAQNVDLPAILAGAEIAPGYSRDLLSCFCLGELADKLPEELSGGQAQRIAMVRALALRPKLVLADEPTGQLDGTTAQSFMDAVLEHVEGMGAALVVATHDEAIAARMATRWTMDHGRLSRERMKVAAT
ncbi:MULTISPECIES: ABC transporter ATP-binding protein [unclassified Rhizobium]|uniref:ABC transporter ATP-binding protein n=1 Tax=unclassified Rhizobium TaxID=2613769 RepID=UPI000EAA9956|nr:MULTISPECIES: ABC transporter ATP-binding protein [unclassified Rhizobium]AYG69728.1 ABC transporter ATP-binding protein [Rhizobium sp. CCGE531]AYG76103.1 ABC transporter ATP-binding protein [Rhizobium sp. CCGE532]